MLYNKQGLLVVIFVFILLITINITAKQNQGAKKKPQNTTSTLVSSTYLDINNLKALESNIGFSDYNLNSNLEGMEFPKGSGKSVIYETGLIWGGFVQGDPQVRVGGSAYISGLQPGPILSNGQPAPNPTTDSRWRIYRVRPDVYPGGTSVDLSNDALIEGLSETQIRAQYEADWTEWPAAGTTNDLGAPFTDVNGDGKYEPNVDIPGVPGADQTIYYVANDLNAANTVSMYGAQPLGIELHATYWAYKDGGALGNTYFKKYDLINKGYQQYTIDSMFVSFWADPDLGYANDDVVGTDTTLNMIYTYNGEPVDPVYAPDTPPSIGFTQLQGPIVNGIGTDTAIINGEKKAGKKNLPMTASYFFVNGNANFGDPPQGEIAGSTQFYNFFNGEYGLTGQEYTYPINNIPTKFVFTGDPVAQTGWIDGVQFAPADRRQGMASGPFTFAPGDTQEVVFAEIAGVGVDYRHSVYTVRKYWYDASLAYNNMLLGIKTPYPPSPSASIANDSSAVQIQWQNNAESFNDSGYKFEGYNVYQLSSSSASKEASKLIAVYDKADGIKIINGEQLDPATDKVTLQQQQFGTDSGLEYKFTATKDYINNAPFIKGKKYSYTVTAYSFNPDLNANPSNTESNFETYSVAYNYNLPGPNYGDTVQVVHAAGPSTGDVVVIIVDPSKLTGHSYAVLFDTVQGNITWSLKDLTLSTTLLTNQVVNSTLTIDGVQITVTSPRGGMKDWSVPQGTRRVTWAGNSLAASYGFEGFNGCIGWASPDYLYVTGNETISANQLCNTLITYAQVTDTSLYNPQFPPLSDINFSFGYRYLRHASTAPADPRFTAHIINTSGGVYPFQDFAQTVPLSAWNVNDPAHPQRLAVGYLENNQAGALVDGKYWPPDYLQVDQATAREFLWIFQAPYSKTPNPAFEVDALGSNPLPIMWFIMWERKGPVPFSPDYSGEDQFLITSQAPMTVDDRYTFNTSILTDVKTGKIVTDYSLEQNYPNPFNPSTTIEFSVPRTERVTLKIYDLLGREIKTLVNEDKSQGSYRVEFNAGYLASGVYFYRMQAGNFAQTKKLILLK